jgi:hypothetical protein
MTGKCQNRICYRERVSRGYSMMHVMPTPPVASYLAWILILDIATCFVGVKQALTAKEVNGVIIKYKSIGFCYENPREYFRTLYSCYLKTIIYSKLNNTIKFNHRRSFCS